MSDTSHTFYSVTFLQLVTALSMLLLSEKKKGEKRQEEILSLVQSALDGLSARIAPVDEKGTIVLVNKQWRNFAKENQLTPDMVSEGVNYFDVCRQAEGEWSKGAMDFARGLQRVLNREEELFTLEYPCPAPDKEFWFRARVTPLPDENRNWAVVAHQDITEQ